MKLLLLLAAQVVVDHRCVDERDRLLPKEYLDQARSLRVLFGHQSVGGNLLEGLEDLANADADRYAIERPSDPDADWFAEGRGIAEFGVGQNDNPRSKIEHFVRKIRKEGFGDRVDVAMMKLCFLDFGESEADADAVFESYRDAFSALEKDYPRIRFVWWTAPLADGGNRARHRFNERVREHCVSKEKALFDLADLECHDPRGKRHEADGTPLLYPGYTEDGGHLTEEGRRRVARAFWWLLARVAGWSGK